MAHWTNRAQPHHDSARRLFDGPLASALGHQAPGILSGLFNYLAAACYLAGNPPALRHGRIAITSCAWRFKRYLDTAPWRIMLESMESWATHHYPLVHCLQEVVHLVPQNPHAIALKVVRIAGKTRTFP
ncbi:MULTISPECIES: hypothetical protein [unclassified Burkholderia]|uniref:hypothetical protein n=1 Tax=unclassified Burkholderia TaxID=2613784 RepID=UPI002AAF601A|nr:MULTISPECIES: hypothetical protein [unclassified Burkholderia]